jgi:hypothetical protein
VEKTDREKLVKITVIELLTAAIVATLLLVYADDVIAGLLGPFGIELLGQ